MRLLKKHLKPILILALVGTVLFTYRPVLAESDQAMFEQYLRTREGNVQTQENHGNHVDSSKTFHGVFYGFVPCEDCLGTKMTLSLNQGNNYLLVIQYTKPGAREIYEKGKYFWDDEKHNLVLTPRKGTGTRHFLIEDSETLAQLNGNGTKMSSEHVLRRSDTVKARQVHIH